MGYKLSKKEKLVSGIKRIILEQTDKALKYAVHYQDDPEKAVHEIRKCLKRIRATLRLVRYELGNKKYRKLNNFYRDTSRLLAPVSEIAVRIRTLDSLKVRYQKTIDDTLYYKLRNSLQSRQNLLIGSIIKRSNIFKTITAKLEESKTEINNLTLKNKNFKIIEDGLLTIYAKGKDGLKKAHKKPDTELIHEWRKYSKYLWHHMEILQIIWPNMLKEMSRTMNEFTENLGYDHDLAELVLILYEESQYFSNGISIEPLEKIVFKQRKKLQQASWSIGERIYVEKPKDFVKRIRSYWKSYEKHHR
jgi:CHAD domain-containing protein